MQPNSKRNEGAIGLKRNVKLISKRKKIVLRDRERERDGFKTVCHGTITEVVFLTAIGRLGLEWVIGHGVTSESGRQGNTRKRRSRVTSICANTAMFFDASGILMKTFRTTSTAFLYTKPFSTRNSYVLKTLEPLLYSFPLHTQKPHQPQFSDVGLDPFFFFGVELLAQRNPLSSFFK